MINTLDLSRWKLSTSANVGDTNAASSYFKYYEQGGNLRLAVNVSNVSSLDTKDLLNNFRVLFSSETMFVSIVQVDDGTKYRTGLITDISALNSNVFLIEASLLDSNGSLVNDKEYSLLVNSKGEVGPQGYRGFQGHPGLSGSQGLQGTQGTQGTYEGAQGFQGHPGYDGPQGPEVQGFQGPPGPQGFQGITPAPQGVQGAQGFQGAQGSRGGPKGVQGVQGVQGYQGYPGNNGHRGIQGSTGVQGSFRGYQGPQGPQGTQGMRGFQGVLGPQGTQGTQGTQGSQGPQGYQGPQGFQGPQGPQGTQGEEGFLGSQGNQGLQGFEGDAGDPGPQGTQGITVTGPQGFQGTQGSQGFQGTQGPQGVQGPQGNRGGTQGFQGPQGAPATNDSTIYMETVGDSTVSLLLHMDGTNNSTTFTDRSYSPKTVTAYGNAKISTAISKFGGASAAFDGNGDYLLLDNTADLAFGSGAFTIEGWVYLNAVSYQTVFSKHTPSVAADIGFVINNSTSIIIGLNNTPGGFVRTVPTISANTWYHFAIVGNGSGTIKVYWNGVQAGADISAASVNNAVPKWIIGADQWSSPAYFLNGYLDEFRITKGLARYTTNFTPPSAAFANADGSAELPAGPSVGKIVHSSDGAYACSSASPVVWKKYPIVPRTFSKTAGEVIKASNLPPRWISTDAFDFLSWRLNEGPGSTTFASSLNSGASSNLTIAETTNFRAGVDDGLFQKTITFVGNAASVGRFLTGGAAHPPTSNKSFSMSHWMIPYSNSPSGGADPITFGKLFYANSAWANPIVGLFIALDGTSWRIYANIEGTGTYTIPASSSIPLTLNVPVLVAVTFDGYYLRLYQNGILAGTSANLNDKQIIMGDGPWFAGKAPVGFPGHSFDGQLWDIRVANTVRSAAYYRAMYLDGTGRTED